MSCELVAARRGLCRRSPHRSRSPDVTLLSPRHLRQLAVIGVLLCFTVVALGAYVRLTAAGLGCPDWPGCYGHITPSGAVHALALGSRAQALVSEERPLMLGKAWREMIHRYAAGTLAVVIAVIAGLALTYRRRAPVHPAFALMLVGIVIVQAALGMLTVTWQLEPLIVTLHLLFGMTTLALLWWLLLSLSRGYPSASAPRLTRNNAGETQGQSSVRPVTVAAAAALAALAVQIALGGWTSSNYAAIACPDFPTCQGAWWPRGDFGHAFALWNGLNINYEGGVLASPARVAIHLTHRLGAVIVSVTLAFTALFVLRRERPPAARRAALAVLAALGLQLLIGTFMVLKAFPLWLATAHTAGAALLLLATLALLRSVTAR